jgi:putative endonuclease
VQGIGKRFVYILRSDVDSRRHYVGSTRDVNSRLAWHNRGPSGYTVQFRPWSVVVIVEFPTERVAVRFEKYLKSASGRAFATRHFGWEPGP